jgi:YebC/PmpR family DNA-binding regulatory protein
MSGHSKWHNIQAKKGKADAARGKIFTKLGRELLVAAKEGGSNPDTNSKLKDVISKAKTANMPMDTINRAVKRGAGELGDVNYEEIMYEGYGPNGVAFIVSSLTDNRNRTASNVRHAFERSGGSLGTTGCVAWMFERKGVIIVEKSEGLDEEELMMLSIDAGADDFTPDNDIYEIITPPESFSNVVKELEDNGIKLASAELSMIPSNTVELDNESATKVDRMIERLDDDDDVQNVWHNAEFPDGWGEEEE